MTDQPDSAAPVENTEQADSSQSADARVGDAVSRLDGLEDLPPEEHVEVYEQVHAVLAQSLADAQADRAGAAPSGPEAAQP